jgi:hypothetical protein
MDFVIFNSIMSSVWYIFTILFVLYRFTSFFTYMYGFVRFCKKLWDGIGYCWTQVSIYLQKRRGYIPADSDEPLLSEFQPQSTFQQIKGLCFNMYKKAYSFIWQRPYPISPSHTSIPMYKTQVGSYFDRSDETRSPRQSEDEQKYFDKQLSDLLDSDSSNIDMSHNTNLTSSYFNKISLQSSGDRRFFHSPLSSARRFESVDLYTPPSISSSHRSHLYPPSSLLLNSNYIKQTLRGSPPNEANDNTSTTDDTIQLLSPPINITSQSLSVPLQNDFYQSNSFYQELSKNPYI